jgi:hypothetical protein
MLVSHYTRDFDSGGHGLRLTLKCDTCGTVSRCVACDPCHTPDEWDRLPFYAAGWTRQLTGRILRDVCPDCSALPNCVATADACPSCGERHVDRLVWQDDEHVRCHACGTMYAP